MNLEEIKFFTRILRVFIIPIIKNFNMNKYILRLVFCKRRIMMCLINEKLTLNEFVLSISVKKKISRCMPPLLLKTDFLEEFLLAIEENNIIKNKSK